MTAYHMTDFRVRKETDHYVTICGPVIERLTVGEAHDFLEWLFSQGLRHVGEGPHGCIICEKIDTKK
jgi:hypothetical protein